MKPTALKMIDLLFLLLLFDEYEHCMYDYEINDDDERAPKEFILAILLFIKFHIKWPEIAIVPKCGDDGMFTQLSLQKQHI